MSFHLRFVSSSLAGALAAVAEENFLPDTIKAVIVSSLTAIPGDGPIEVEAIGHLAVPSVTPDHRLSQGSWITSLKVLPIRLRDPAPPPEPVIAAVAPNVPDGDLSVAA